MYMYALAGMHAIHYYTYHVHQECIRLVKALVLFAKVKGPSNFSSWPENNAVMPLA